MKIEWVIVPDDLPFSPLMGLKSLDIAFTEAFVENGEVVRLGLAVNNIIQSFGPGSAEVEINDISSRLNGFFELDENAGGSMSASGLVPSFEPNFRRLRVGYELELLINGR